METCEAIMEFDYVEAYLDQLSLFKTICANFPKSLEYVGGVILRPMKEKLVRAQIDRIMHIENTTTNKVEYAHNKLKRYKGILEVIYVKIEP